MLFARAEYEKALAKYLQAFKYCRKHQMKKEMALIRANCAQACLKLKLYQDAITHCNECVKLDNQNQKGFYRRAEALRALLPGARDLGTYVDVVRDYIKCHTLQQNVEAFSQAVQVAVEHSKTT